MKNFSRIYIEITNVCNLSCSFCARNSRGERVMGCDEFLHIANQLTTLTDHIYLHVLGEPLMHPNLAKILSISHDAGLSVNITTNGSLLKKTENVLFKAPALRKVSISVHCLESNNSLKCESYLSDISSFAKQGAQKGLNCELRLWNYGVQDINNKPIFTQLCTNLGLSNNETSSIWNNLCKSNNVTIFPHLFVGKAERFEWPSLNRDYTDNPTFCHGLRSQIAILCDGTVVPCCLDSNGDIPLGNIFSQPLSNILNSERVNAIINGFSQRKPYEDLCKRCSYATRF